MIAYTTPVQISNDETLHIDELSDGSMGYMLSNSSHYEKISEEHALKILLHEEEETIIKLMPLSNKLADLRIARHRIFDKNSIHFNS